MIWGYSEDCGRFVDGVSEDEERNVWVAYMKLIEAWRE